MTTNWLFTSTATVRSDEVEEGGGGTMRAKRGETKKMRAREEKLCQDPYQFLGEIKLPYGFAVNRNMETICHGATFKP